MSSRRCASEEQIPPNSGASHLIAGYPSKKKPRTLLTYDPALEVVTATIDPDIETHNETELGKFEVLQTVEHNEQGYYLLCKNMRLRGYFGPVLVKYLGRRNVITRQLYSGVGVSAEVAAEIRLAEDKKNPEREIRFARELVHENIVRILGFISPNGRPDSINAIIMEGDFDGILEVYASRKQIPLPLVKVFALQLASALEYCHSLGIMHRDVRVRNIYVQDENRIKLGNFGYARVGNKDDIHTSNKGEELYYRAPEMISSNATTVYTFSVDVYGFALVLWSMLHGGKKPYKDDPACERLVRNETRFKQYLEKGNRPRIDDNVDQGLIKLIEECWVNETEFNKRPSMSNVVLTLQNISFVSLESVPRPLAEFAIKSPSRSPEQLKEQKTIEFSSTLRRYTLEKIGLTEDQLKVSQQPYIVDASIFGKIRLVSVEEDYIPYIPKLLHKNIVAQYGLLETKNHGYFLMLERTVGTSVQKHLEENKPTEEITRSWLLDASRALNYCQSLNFPYGELSLDRLLIHESGLKLEHPGVFKNYGQGVKQDLLELCKLTSSNDQLKSLSEKIERYDPVFSCRNPAPYPVLRHDFIRTDTLTQDQLKQAEEISQEGDSKRVFISRLGYVTRTALRDDLITYQRSNRLQNIFSLQHPNLLKNYFFLRSDEADVNLPKFKAIISERVSLAFDIFLDAAGTLKLHLIPYQLIQRQRNFNYTADEVRDGLAPTKESDVYSTAAVEYFILEGKEPSTDKSGLHFETISPEADQILVRAWSVDPTERPSLQQMFDVI